jgi:hypothetical protein
MSNMTERQGTAGFTRTELLVLLGVVAVFSVALAADLTQTRMTLLQQACAANLKQWGLAFDLYAQDYNGTFYYDVAGLHFDESGSPLERYFGSIDSNHTKMRTLRVCPAVAAAGTANLITAHSYNMPIGNYRRGFTYAKADSGPPSPYYGTPTAPYWPHLKSCPNPSKFLLLIECSGHTTYCGGLVNAVSTVLPTHAD